MLCRAGERGRCGEHSCPELVIRKCKLGKTASRFRGRLRHVRPYRGGQRKLLGHDWRGFGGRSIPGGKKLKKGAAAEAMGVSDSSTPFPCSVFGGGATAPMLQTVHALQRLCATTPCVELFADASPVVSATGPSSCSHGISLTTAEAEDAACGNIAMARQQHPPVLAAHA